MKPFVSICHESTASPRPKNHSMEPHCLAGKNKIATFVWHSAPHAGRAAPKRKQYRHDRPKHIAHTRAAAPARAAADGIRCRQRGIPPPDRGRGHAAQGEARRRMVAAAHGPHLLQLAQPVLHRGVPHVRHRDRAQLRVRQARGVLPRHGRRRRHPGLKAHRGRATGQAEILRVYGHGELCRRRPHGGGTARRRRRRGAAGCHRRRRAAVVRRDELPPDVRRARPHHAGQGAARLPARPVLLAPRARPAHLCPYALPLPQRHAARRRQRGAQGQGRGHSARPAGHGQDHHFGRGHTRNAAARAPSDGVRTEQHGGRLDIREARRPRCERAAHRQPHAGERQDAVVYLRAPLRVACTFFRRPSMCMP